MRHDPTDPMHPENRETLDVEPEDRGDRGDVFRKLRGDMTDAEWEEYCRRMNAEYWQRHYAKNPPEKSPTDSAYPF